MVDAVNRLRPGAPPSPAPRTDDDPVKVADSQNLHRYVQQAFHTCPDDS